MNRPRDGWGVALLCLAGVALAWGSMPIFLKSFVDYIDWWTANGVRYPVGALFWLPFVVVLVRQGAGRIAVPVRRAVWRDALVPALCNLLAQSSYAASFYFMPASTVGFVIRLSFPFTVLLGFAFLADERPLAGKLAFWLGAGTSLAGVLLMFLEGLVSGGKGTLVGLAITIAMAATWAAYAVSVRRCMVGYPARLSFGVISLYSSTGFVALMLTVGRFHALGSLPVSVWGWLLLSALLGIAFGHVLYYRAINRLGPVVAGGVLLVTPFVTYLGAGALLGERLTVLQLSGGVAVVVGGALLLRARVQVERAGSRAG